MGDSIRIVSKVVMMAAAVTFSVAHHHKSFNTDITLGLFCLATATHIVMSLSSSTLPLYTLAVTVLTPILVIIVVSQPQYILVAALPYAPLLVAFTLYIIEDCSRWHLETPCIIPRWSETRASSIQTRRPSPPSSPTTLYRHMLASSSSATDKLIYPSPPPSSTVSSRTRGRESTLSTRAQDALLTKFMGSPSQSCATSFSSRLSDISLTSSRPDSLPSSWGTLTRAWFPEYSARETDSFP